MGSFQAIHGLEKKRKEKRRIEITKGKKLKTNTPVFFDN